MCVCVCVPSRLWRRLLPSGGASHRVLAASGAAVPPQRRGWRKSTPHTQPELRAARCCSLGAMLLSRRDAALSARCCSLGAMLLCRRDAALSARCCSLGAPKYGPSCRQYGNNKKRNSAREDAAANCAGSRRGRGARGSDRPLRSFYEARLSSFQDVAGGATRSSPPSFVAEAAGHGSHGSHGSHGGRRHAGARRSVCGPPQLSERIWALLVGRRRSQGGARARRHEL